MSRAIAYGIDFGTTNSSVSVVFEDGAELGVVDDADRTVMPSIVYVDATRNRLAGFDAVDNYLRFGAQQMQARLMSSLKSFLADDAFSSTECAWGEQFTMPDLVAILLRQLKRVNDVRVGADVRRAVIGHPVLFAGAEGPRFETLQQLALDRLDEAARLAGFTDVVFLDEPTAALMGEELEEGLVMAVDFGGGTFDASIIELTPSRGDVLAIQGAAIGGELFDSLLFDAKVAPALGLDRHYEVHGRRLPVPAALLRMRTLADILQLASDFGVYKAVDFARSVGQPLAMVEEILLGGHAYTFFQAVEQTKIDLSSVLEARLAFRRPGVRVVADVTRSEFDALIHRNLRLIDDQIDKALAQAGVSPDEIDVVARTGGSSRIPAFVNLLVRRFGHDRLAERDALSTVALGLGIRAWELWG
jgi:hypothetical chaperone protein